MNKVINVVRASLPPFEEYVEEISDIWESRWLTHTGPKHQQLEKDLESFWILRMWNCSLMVIWHWNWH